MSWMVYFDFTKRKESLSVSPYGFECIHNENDLARRVELEIHWHFLFFRIRFDSVFVSIYTETPSSN